MIEHIQQSLTIFPEETLASLGKKLRLAEKNCAYIVDQHHQLRGVVTKDALFIEVVEHAKNPQTAHAREIMLPIEAVEFEHGPTIALELMTKMQLMECPITKYGRFLGCVSYRDALAQIMDKQK